MNPALLAILPLLTALVAAGDQPCLANHRYSNPENCSTFHTCVGSHLVLQNCPKDLHFNNVTKVCDWPYFAKCTEIGFDCEKPGAFLANPADCSTFFMCNDINMPVLMNCSEGLHFNVAVNNCDWPENANCTANLLDQGARKRFGINL